MSCCHCGRPSIYEMPDANGRKMMFCLDCAHKVTEINQARLAASMNQMNYLADMMEATTGIPGVLPRYKIPTPVHVQQKGPVTFHNIQVDRSVVGAINTGEVGSIDVAMDNIGDPHLVKALKEFTEAVINDKTLQPAKKNEVIEQLAFLSSQAAAPKAERKPSIIRTVIANVASAAATAGLTQAWTALLPLLQGLIS